MSLQRKKGQHGVPHCARCGGTNITTDAIAQFDPRTGEWVLSALLDSTDCEDCGDECRVVYKPMAVAAQEPSIGGRPSGAPFCSPRRSD